MEMNVPEVHYFRHAVPMLVHCGTAALNTDAELSVRNDLGPSLQEMLGGEGEELVRPRQDLCCLQKLLHVKRCAVKMEGNTR